MRTNLLSTCVLLVAVTSACFGQQRGTGMLFLSEPESPANLIETLHTNTDFLQAAKLKNTGDKTITGYRIGWVVLYPSGKSKVGLGLAVDVPEGIKPGEVASVPAQQVSVAYAKEGATSVVFFVTEVHFTSGSVWKPDTEVFEARARELEKTTVD